MSDTGRCTSCGLLLDPPGPGGLCPVCLLKMGLDASAGTEGAGTETVSPGAAEVPGVIGPYHLLQVLGEGGMGLVYLAEQREPLVRRVALKLIKPGMDTREVLARFEAERQALAFMDHPNIARVLDAGLGPGERPYFVMEYVAGVPITDYCDRHRLRNTERLQIFLQVCAALQHAHQKGIIHRDLKPSNILVTVQDGKPVPKVIDFGIAKATRQGSLERAAFTQLGMFIGTPEYISPEQAQAGRLEVDTTTDIYSLGVVLYELLTGVLPFDAELLRRAGYAEMHRIIREQDPPKPSLRVTALGATAADIARQHQTTQPALGKQLPGGSGCHRDEGDGEGPHAALRVGLGVCGRHHAVSERRSGDGEPAERALPAEEDRQKTPRRRGRRGGDITRAGIGSRRQHRVVPAG